MHTIPFRPLLTLAGAAALLLTLLATVGCASGASTHTASTSAGVTPGPRTAADFERDRAAILGMTGEYKVSFDFAETLAIREGYELADPYHSEANELVLLVEDTGEFISLQHLLVVTHGGESHVIKHWRQDWAYESSDGYSFQGDNVWEPIGYDTATAKGTWVQSVYQVDDSPRYWGRGTWIHRDGVSTWSSTLTNRPLPRREFSKRSDYQILSAINTHVVTPDGWMHYQSNYKLDLESEDSPVIALESGVNTYERVSDVDFAAAHEYWDNTAVYWAQVRAVWDDIFTQQETVALRSAVRGDPMYNHLFDLADEYWGDAECADARGRVAELIGEFRTADAIAQPE
ncbi:MAG: DUF6607 family protein [Phycisphaerales bacterium JB063]